MSMIDVISDYANKNLGLVPNKVMKMFNLKMLYLEGNMIEKLPDDFFENLTRLTWLDLRKNKLKTIPVGIANHLCLETLLLQDNEIEELPNEIGLVPRLKVLQLNGNPLKYPTSEIIKEGTQSICNFLKQEYYKSNQNPASEDDEEREMSAVARKSSSDVSKSSEKISVRDLLRRSGKNRKTFCLMPVIDVKSLNKPNPNEEDMKAKNSNFSNLYPSSGKNTHKITKNCSKISLHSHAQWNPKKKLSSEDKAEDNGLKEIWLQRLKELLADQAKILQQEKNLRTLSKWRLEKKAEAPRTPLEEIPEAPFATDPECRMLSRQELTTQIDQMIKRSKKPSKRPRAGKKLDIQNLINQVVDQMKNMETKLNDSPRSPRTEQEIATKQIENIVELHKKIVKLQATNDTSI